MLTGDLSTQLFIVATALALSREYPHRVVLTQESKHNILENIPIDLDPDATICAHRLNQSEFCQYFKDSPKLTTPLDPCKNYIFEMYLGGYFQSHRYFWHARRHVANGLHLNPRKIALFRTILAQFEPNPIVAIHARWNHHLYEVLDDEYYERMIGAHVPQGAQIILFGNTERLWNLMKSRPNVVSAYELIGPKEEDHLLLMSMCNVRVCSNSTFPLWACYMGEMFFPTTRSIFPVAWFSEQSKRKYFLPDIIPISENIHIDCIQKPMQNDRRMYAHVTCGQTNEILSDYVSGVAHVKMADGQHMRVCDVIRGDHVYDPVNKRPGKVIFAGWTVHRQEKPYNSSYKIPKSVFGATRDVILSGICTLVLPETSISPEMVRMARIFYEDEPELPSHLARLHAFMVPDAELCDMLPHHKSEMRYYKIIMAHGSFLEMDGLFIAASQRSTWDSTFSHTLPLEK